MLKIEFNDNAAQAALKRLMETVPNTREAMVDIANEIMNVSQRSFETSSSPSGVAWATNTEATYLSYLQRVSGIFDNGKRIGDKKGYFKKDGTVASKSVTSMIGKKPLLGSSKDLVGGFTYEADAQSVTVFNTMEYAAMQQFGGTKGKFPQLWGDIPARPFMPLDASGRPNEVANEIVVRIINLHIQNAADT